MFIIVLKNTRMGYVYLIKDTCKGTYKIGVTKGPIQSRLKKLQTGNSGELIIENFFETDYPFRLETMLHNKFKIYNIINEWYDLPEDIVKNFFKICQQNTSIIETLQFNPYFTRNLK